MHNYGLISDVDAATLEKTMDLICADFYHHPICILEVGLYNGRTSKGIKEYIESKGREVKLTGIDNYADGEKLVFYPPSAELIVGNSSDVYYKIPDHSQHLIFIDANHSYLSVIQDFFAYSDKVKYDGFLAFHDTGKHIQEKTDWQRIGDKENPDTYIAVRKALRKLGLIDTTYTALEADGTFLEEWEVVFDEADPNDKAGGVTVFKRIA
jgi:hypothetical protein